MLKYAARSLIVQFCSVKHKTRVLTLSLLKSDYEVPNVNTGLFHPFTQTICQFSSQNVKDGENSASQDLDINAITNGDPALEKKLKVLMLEVDVWRQEGRQVPDILNTKHWTELLELQSVFKRLRYLTFLFKIEKKGENLRAKKEERKRLQDEMRSARDSEEVDMYQYGLHHNTLFLRLYDTTENRFYNNRLIQAMQYSQALVLDCGYDQFMTKLESKNCAKQLCISFAENRMHKEPFNLYFCNSNLSGPVISQLSRYIPKLYEDSFPINITEKSYLDLFPKKNLVYLTPHCRNELGEDYDHDNVYIIGAMVDKSNQEPLSLAKAKKEGLKMAKLPLDHYLYWNSGSGKSLTINQMVCIMLDWRNSNDWNVALKHVPTRKFLSDERLQNLNPNIVKKEALLDRQRIRDKRSAQAIDRIFKRSLFNE